MNIPLGQISKLEEGAMQKKSLISSLQTTKKANVAAAQNLPKTGLGRM
jgi:hypothetical protein